MPARRMRDRFAATYVREIWDRRCPERPRGASHVTRRPRLDDQGEASLRSQHMTTPANLIAQPKAHRLPAVPSPEFSVQKTPRVPMNRFAKMFLAFLLFLVVSSIGGCNASGGGSAGGGGSTPTPTTPIVTVTPATTSITSVQSLNVTITVSGTSSTPTGLVVLSSGTYGSSAATLSKLGSATISIPAGSLATGSNTLDSQVHARFQQLIDL